MTGIKKLFNSIRNITKDFSEIQIPVFSAYAAFFFILAVFPTLMLLMYLVRLTPLSETDMMMLVNELAPTVIRPLLILVSEELYSKLSGAFIGVTGFTLVWSASRCMVGLIGGLNSVYGVDETRGYFAKRFIAFFYMILFIIALMLLLLFHVFWNFVVAMLSRYFSFVMPLPVNTLRYIIILFMLTALFMLVFKVFPNRKARLRLQLPGAALAAASWMVFTWLFSVYVNYFSNYSYLYGSLTVIVLAMLWMYFSMMILFVGGAINVYLEKHPVSFRNTRF